VLGANAQNSIAMQKWRLGFVRPFNSAFLNAGSHYDTVQSGIWLSALQKK
jgi:hypothetical protein